MANRIGETLGEQDWQDTWRRGLAGTWQVGNNKLETTGERLWGRAQHLALKEHIDNLVLVVFTFRVVVVLIVFVFELFLIFVVDVFVAFAFGPNPKLRRVS